MNWVIEHDVNWLPICKLCGKSFNKLWSHLRMTHKILTSEYRKQFWLDKCARLMSKYSIELAKKRNKENYELVVTENLINKWVKTRYKNWDKWRTRDKIRTQTALRLSNNSLQQHKKNLV